MPRPRLEVADIFRAHGPAYRRDHAGHLNLPQLKVMSAIEACRTVALGGHVAACTKCDHQHIAYKNKAEIYGLLFNASAQTLLTIAADPKHLGARIGMTSVLHTWGSAMTHHPHVHVIVPGGGLSPDGTRWVACRPGFFLPVKVLSRLFRRLFLEGLWTLHRAGKLAFFGNLSKLTDPDTFQA